MAENSSSGPDMTIDELARQAELPVRTIREYHTVRLLPPPERRGRVGYYGPGHVHRLELIARLQRRGYSLAGIRDLLQAWAAGADLTSLLGIEPGQAPGAPLDEMPLRLTRDELLARVPALSGSALGRAREAGLIQSDGDDVRVRSPALLVFVADGIAAGVPVSDMLNLAGTLRRQLSSLAEIIADLIADRLLPALQAGQSPGELVPLLQRGRLLLIQGSASLLADSIGAALLRRSAGSDGGAALRAAIEQIRVGAVADGSGTIRYGGAS